MFSKEISDFLEGIIKINAVWVILVGLLIYIIRYFWFLRDKDYAFPFIQPEYMVSDDNKPRQLYKTIKGLLKKKNKVRFITILGDYGSGKSYFINYLYYQLRKWSGISWYKKVKRIRLKGKNFDEEIKSINDDYKNYTILLLDGFDEDEAAIMNIQKRYQDIVNRTQDFGKVILTSRLTFWGDLHPEEVKIFFDKKSLQTLYLAPFSKEQVQKYLNRKFWYCPWVARNLQQRINQNPCFQDLSVRPLLLSYMDNELLTNIEQNNNQYASHLNHGLKNIKRKVFEVITREIFDGKEHYFFENQMEFDRIMSLISYDMIVNFKQIPFASFESYFQAFHDQYNLSGSFNKDYANAIELESSTVKNRMLLVKLGEEIIFSHRSFAEFYTALCIELFYLGKERMDFTIPSKEVADFICFEKDNLRFIPGGKFLMGEQGKQQEVKIESFFMGISPVTNQEYEQFDPTHREKRDKISGADDEPVIYVSWEEANRYCRWLSKKKGYNYDLPTEAEWEYACRARSSGLYSQDINGIEATEMNLKNYAVYNAKKTMPVKKRKPNFYGLYEMHGNVWEWCQDYYNNSKTSLRGGSWVTQAEGLRSSCRYYLDPDGRGSIISFRVVSVARTLKR
jgi:hypothetical protein